MFWKNQEGKNREVVWNPWKSLRVCAHFIINGEIQVSTDWDEKVWFEIKSKGRWENIARELKAQKAESSSTVIRLLKYF